MRLPEWAAYCLGSTILISSMTAAFMALRRRNGRRAKEELKEYLKWLSEQ